jgi:hypothetical protein
VQATKLIVKFYNIVLNDCRTTGKTGSLVTSQRARGTYEKSQGLSAAAWGVRQVGSGVALR